MIPARYAPFLFGLILSCLMSLIITGVATLRTVGLAPDLLEIWRKAWLSSWIVAFPAVLVVGPFARRVVARLTRKP